MGGEVNQLMSISPDPDIRTQEELLDDLYNTSSPDLDRTLKRLAAVGEAEALDEVVDFLRSYNSDARKTGLDTLRVLANKYTPTDRYGLAEALISFLDDPELAQRLSATRLLNTHPNELATYPLRDLVYETFDQLHGEVLNRFSPRRLLTERLLGESIMAMANCGRMTVLPDIIELVEEPIVRPVATRAIGVIGSETERDLLEELAEDHDVRVRDAAQWALGLMDDRMDQFLNPPTEIPEPPPDRINPIYWSHRQLVANDDDLSQFMVVRVGIEHLLLDSFLGDGRIPEGCVVFLCEYEGTTPPDFRREDRDMRVIQAWQYRWHGPSLRKLDPAPEIPSVPQAPTRLNRLSRSKNNTLKSSITISYPADMHYTQEGLVSFDCLFEPYFGRGWFYHIAHNGEQWQFSRIKPTWRS